jgi:hypothetical protein
MFTKGILPTHAAEGLAESHEVPQTDAEHSSFTEGHAGGETGVLTIAPAALVVPDGARLHGAREPPVENVPAWHCTQVFGFDVDWPNPGLHTAPFTMARRQGNAAVTDDFCPGLSRFHVSIVRWTGCALHRSGQVCTNKVRASSVVRKAQICAIYYSFSFV